MKTNLSLLAFDEQPLAARACAAYESALAPLSDGEAHFKFFNDIKSLFVALAQAVESSSAIALAVPASRYLTVKKLLFTALHTKTTVSQEIAERMRAAGEPENEEYALMSEAAEILPSQNGVNSGFIERRGSQTLFFLPLENAEASQICPYLQRAVESMAAAGVPAQESREAEARENPVENVEETSGQAAGCDPVLVAEKLRDCGIRAAVAQSKFSAFVFSVLPPDDDESTFDDVIFPFDARLDNDELSQKEYIASLAGRARTDSGATLGVSVSNVYAGTQNRDELFMLFCVADEHNARLFKIYSREGESSQEFIYACIHRLYSVLDEYAEHCGFIFQDPYNPQPLVLLSTAQDIQDRQKKSGGKAALIVTMIAALALVLGVAVTFLVQAYFDRRNQPDVSQSSTHSPDLLDVFEDFIFSDIENDEDSTQPQSSVESTTASTSPSSTLTAVSTLLSSATSVFSSSPAVIPTTPASAPGESSTAAPRPSVSSGEKTGVFTFTVYGYGHGVGMSQSGARAYAANSGWSYSQILLHYYNATGVQIMRDIAPPQTVSYNDVSYPLVEYLAKSTRAEMGASAPAEAFKAQVIAIYTYAKRSNFEMTSSHHAFNESYNYEGTAIHSAVNAVLYEYLAFNGTPAFTPYFSSSAGKTTSCDNAWGGGSNFPYLGGGRTSPETDVMRTLTISSEQIKAKVNAYNATVADSQKISLQNDPAEWIKIISHDSAVSSSVGYADTVQIGNRTMRGNQFRLNIMGASTLRSHCFSYTYTPD